MSEPARILVTDDDPNLRKTLGDVLEFKGYVPVLAETGEIAVQRITQEDIAVALIDLRLGDMAGLDVVRAIREHSPETECILLTGHASKDSAIDAVNLGAYSYFQKPFDLERLLLSIRHAVERREAKRALAESEARYHTFLEATVDSAFLKDDQFRYLIVNDANAHWFGKPSAEIIGKDDFELTDTEVARLARVSDQQVLDSNAPVTIVETVRDRIYETSKFPVRFRDGRVGVGGYSRDITERKLAEERLILLSTALDAAANAIIITDRDGTVEWVNQAASTLTGYSADETIGKNPRDLIKSGLHDQEFYKSLWSTILAGQVWHGRFTNRRKDGTLYPEDATITPLRDAEGKIQRFIAVKQDVTERVRAEEERERLLAELQEQARRIQGIVDTVPEGVILVDESGRLMLANPIAETDLASLAEPKLAAPFDPDSVRTLTHLGGRLLRELLEAPPQGGWHELEAAGRTFEVIARAMPDGPGGRSWLLVLSDVTRSRQLQRAQGVQERLAAVGQLAAGIAHDFNNIMGVITIYCDLLAKTADLTPKQQHHLGTIRAQADLAANLIHQILDFGRRAPMTRAPLDLLGLVREHVRLLERTLPANIRLKVEADRNDYVVLADPARLQPALMNLALNASDAMPDGGKLVFSLAQLRVSPGQNPLLPVSEEADWVRLDVSDTGNGIPPQHLTRIFEPFFTTKGPGKGTGLGLAQVYGIVQQHDGAIEVHSQVGTGTLFSIYLPLFSVTLPESAALPEVQPVTRGGGTILLAEDNPATREGMTEVLEGHGYRVLPVGTGTAALRLLSEKGEAIDLVLCDLVMPEMGGVELYHRLKEGYPNIKVLFMTGYALEVGEHEELMRAGVAWLQKPFSASALAAKLRDLMEDSLAV